MKRTIVQPADLSGAALAEFKQWLGISSANESVQLAMLLSASLELCESFTAQMPLEQGCEERLAATQGWLALDTRPVRAITSVETLTADGSRNALATGEYEIEIGATGLGQIRLTGEPSDRTLVVSFVAGIAPEWASLPDALRHGIIRLAAHNYRDRDASEPLGPPASVAALWRPWRRLRLA
ncbi:hypothetical protein P7228_07200 [Altererythrobacter arenosus]|uniref:Phage gp6-like head-tail connector protein n=1 Tax=Altererythrobacter arenosus TaxID=3032592 RepID=A0ABY8FVI1_9SPHN|nr:hypothetical protein [Altererythrobacter sp. CAU 1644]WFL78842.1 hypothetical protein P7228_07200 [Altererythrobacter sp. CAU 1644]